LLSQDDLNAVIAAVGAEVTAAVDFAEKSDFPDPEKEYQYFRDVFGA